MMDEGIPRISRNHRGGRGTDFKCATGQFAAKKTLCHVSDLEVNDAGSHQSYSTGGCGTASHTRSSPAHYKRVMDRSCYDAAMMRVATC